MYLSCCLLVTSYEYNDLDDELKNMSKKKIYIQSSPELGSLLAKSALLIKQNLWRLQLYVIQQAPVYLFLSLIT